ncbi:PmbA/TldA family metallopeptidase, partial [Planomonospora algeriensis]
MTSQTSPRMSPQEMVERALELSTADDTVVIADSGSSANLRFAGNTLTTNGVSRSAQLTVISIVGQGVGVVSRAAVRPEDLADLVAAADRAAEDARPSEDARRWSRAPSSADWDRPRRSPPRSVVF